MRTIFFFVLLGMAAQAEAQLMVKLKVADSTSGAPVAFATIRVFKGRAVTPLQMTIAAAEGSFAFMANDTAGIFISITHTSYQPLAILYSKLAASTIFLSPAIKNNIAVISTTCVQPLVERIEDKLAYNVEADTTLDGQMAMQAYSTGSEVLHDPRPFHSQPLYNHYRKHLVMAIFRSNGFIWLAGRPGHVLLWYQASGAMVIELLGTWKAAIIKDTSLLVEGRTALKEMLASKHAVFGDCDNEIIVIVHTRNRNLFIEGLRNCLCNDEEVAQWKAGHTFKDPWPKNLKMLA